MIAEKQEVEIKAEEIISFDELIKQKIREMQ